MTPHVIGYKHICVEINNHASLTHNEIIICILQVMCRSLHFLFACDNDISSDCLEISLSLSGRNLFITGPHGVVQSRSVDRGC